jgi:hypothetical protein
MVVRNKGTEDVDDKIYLLGWVHAEEDPPESHNKVQNKVWV